MMSTEVQKSEGLYYTIIDGTFRRRVAEGTPGATKRDYETSDGTKGTKYEMVIDNLEGIIEDMSIVDGEYGRQLSIMLDKNADGVNPRLQFGVETTYGEDVLKKLPNVDFSQAVRFRPYAFTAQDTGKEVRGVEMKQGDEKLTNFFWDGEKPINGAPVFDGDRDSKDDWKVYFLQVRKFLVNYFNEHVLPKVGKSDLSEEVAAKW